MLKLKTENAFSVISRPSRYLLHVPFVQRTIHLLVKVTLLRHSAPAVQPAPQRSATQVHPFRLAVWSLKGTRS